MPSNVSRPGRTLLRHAAALVAGLALAGVAAPGDARAEDDRDELLQQLNLFSVAVTYAQDEGADAAGYFERAAADCDDVVRRLGRLGVKPTEPVGSEQYPFRDAPARCRTYGQWQQLMTAAPVIAEAAQNLAIAGTIKPGEVSADIADTYGQSAAACTAAVDRALAAGVPASLAVRIRSNLGDDAMTLPAAKTSVCTRLAAWAKAFGPATIAAKQAAADAAKQRYASVGAGGDRLSWLVYYDPDGTGATWFLPGCKEEGDPRKLAKAPVLLRWTEAPDGTHSIRRLQFKGNKLVKDTSRSFLTEAAARRGCK